MVLVIEVMVHDKFHIRAWWVYQNYKLCVVLFY